MSEPTITGAPGTPARARREPNHLRRVILLWGILSLVGIILVIILGPLVLPPSANGDDAFDNATLIIFTALAVPVAMFVFVFTGYSLANFRVRERPLDDAPPIQPGPAVQIGWLGITSFLCLILLVYGLVGFYQQTTASSTNTLVVQVTAQQWLWTFDYPQYSVASQGQVLELPVNRPVQFVVGSKDVLHGFSIRALGIRLDANPGQAIATPVVTPTQLGDYTINCVEMCGLYHSYMFSAVRVVSASDFNAWITGLGGHP